MLSGATCLDLFAGSGVLGIEAASIGASQVVLVEQHTETAKHLAKSIKALSLGKFAHWNPLMRDPI